MTDQERIIAIQARCDAAEKGPWVYGDYGQFVFLSDGGSMVAQMRGWGRLTANPGHMPPDKAAAQQDANGQFLANAREDIPWLLSELAALRGTTAYILAVLEAEAEFHDTTGFVVTRDNLRGLCEKVRAAIKEESK